MQLLYLSLLFAVHFCSFARAKFGSCSDYAVQENFTMSQYLGTWFEIERSGASDSNPRCIMEKYLVTKENKVELLTQYVSEDDAVKLHQGEIIYPNKIKNPAKFYFRISREFERWARYELEPSQTIPMHYWVLATDYTTYSLVYSCVSILGIAHHDYVWIMGRERQLSQNVTDYLHGILTTNDITVDLTSTNQKNCTMRI